MLKIVQFREAEDEENQQKKGKDYRNRAPEKVFAK